MDWEIVYTQTYEDWFLALSEDEQISILAIVELLTIFGPNLSRPYADSIKGTRRVQNLKELRIQHAGKPYRVLYAFDSKRQAILLCGGRKNGPANKRFYLKLIKQAEKLFLDFLKKNRQK